MVLELNDLADSEGPCVQSQNLPLVWDFVGPLITQTDGKNRSHVSDHGFLIELMIRIFTDSNQ